MKLIFQQYFFCKKITHTTELSGSNFCTDNGTAHFNSEEYTTYKKVYFGLFYKKKWVYSELERLLIDAPSVNERTVPLVQVEYFFCLQNKLLMAEEPIDIYS